MHPIETTSFPPEFVPGRDEYIGAQYAARGFTLVDKARHELVLTTAQVDVRCPGSLCQLTRCATNSATTAWQ